MSTTTTLLLHLVARRWSLAQTLLTVLHLENLLDGDHRPGGGFRANVGEETTTSLAVTLCIVEQQADRFVLDDGAVVLAVDVEGRHGSVALVPLGPRVVVGLRCVFCGRWCTRRGVPCARCGDDLGAAVARGASTVECVLWLRTPLTAWSARTV